jgi:DNA-binding NtrC family response regulator
METAGEGPRPVLVVDDDSEMRSVLADFLRGEGFRVDQAGDADEAVRRVGDTRYASVILDNHLPGESGLDALPRLRSLAPDIPVILVTTIGDERLFEMAFTRGAYDLLLKPFSLDDLVEVLRRAAGHAASGASGLENGDGAEGAEASRKR